MLLELARDLVAIPSHDDETAVADYIADWLGEQTDAVVERDTHGNVIARRAPGQEPAVALVGHHDVVPPDDRQVRSDGSYVVEERDGRLYGRGSADMKGSLAAAMVAFREADPAGELVLASFAGEESGGVGCRAAIDDGFAPEYAVVAEGTTGYSAAGVTDVAVAHRGRRGSTVTAHGEAAHASEPDAGVNAIYRAADCVHTVRELEPPSTRVFDHDVTGSLAVTTIDGGGTWNVIPDRCRFTIDERTVPGDRADLETLEDQPGIEWAVDQDLPPMACDDDAFADVALAAAAAAQDSEPAHVVKPHATDAGWLAQAGTTCVVCGAAELGEAHTATESVSIAVLERCRDIYRGIAETPLDD